MQRFTKNIFSIRKDRFRETGSKFESVSINNVDFGKSLNSFNDEDKYYSNFSNTKEKKVYKIIENLYLDIISKNQIFSQFIFDELYYKEKIVDRLLYLINESCNSVYTKESLPNIFKLKHRIEPNIHLYITIKDDIALILLIDLYHLSIPADIYSNGRLVKRVTLSDLPGMYNKVSKYNFSLNHIKEDNYIS